MLGHPLVRGALKQVFAAVDREMAGVVLRLGGVAARGGRLWGERGEDLLAYRRFRRGRWSRSRCTSRWSGSRELARRSDVGGMCPGGAALLRVGAGGLVEINDGW